MGPSYLYSLSILPRNAIDPLNHDASVSFGVTSVVSGLIELSAYSILTDYYWKKIVLKFQNIKFDLVQLIPICFHYDWILL